MRILIACLTSALALSGAAPAVASPDPCPPVIKGSAPKLHPEGVTYDPIRDRFLVGSVVHGTVSVVQPDGSARTLVDEPALITTMGLAVDVRRGRLLVVNGDVGISKKSTPETIGKIAGLGVYDLRTGRRIAYHDLGALDPSRKHFGNDVAIAPDGTAYVTDSHSGTIYRVPLRGKATIAFRDDRLLPVGAGNGANGIVRLPTGQFLIAHSSGRALYKLSGSVLTQVTAAAPVGAPDGLLLRGGALLAIDNTRANRVITLRSPDNWKTASVTASVAWPEPAPTTMAHSRCGVYVLSGRLDQLNPGTDEFWLRRL
ncbi:SMP-30/gluconolactonase/LRE family protein [Lentzea tibetensis]|uniref:SMP-30/gluconolactonase/LRE family protein n=1 Tax=Lentzea tibetensis TaxID=2591470 RepID=A0A563F2S9_9PSEU|nr:SMP-30/gluconolactonase/LRE family protein [Lentzea tibetensis]TWP54277.1 SMP-30/gluconolactonase/LRE family protein [Lentzea tibetensis]